MTLVASVSSYPQARYPEPWTPPQPQAQAGDNSFQYINIPAPATFEWGYRRGNPDHNREEYLSQKDHTFKAKVRNDFYGLSNLTVLCLS